MKNRKGFTLVEILAVVVILGILFAIGVTAYTRFIKKAKDDAYETMILSAKNAMDNYMMDHPGETSATFDTLYQLNYLDKPTDPATKSQDCRGKVTAILDETNADAELEKYVYKISICCIGTTHTFNEATGEENDDRFCKADPFSIEELKESLGGNGIQVLNVYPNSSYANYVQNWMNAYGKDPTTGEQVIFVTPVSLENFNENPSSYLGSPGNWKYEVVVFGFADCYQSKDLKPASAALIRSFSDAGRSVIFGHDTITTGCGNHVNFISLQDIVGLKATSDLAWAGSNQVKIHKTGVFTQYPYTIGTEGSVLTIPTSHVYGQVANGATVWVTFQGISDPNKSIYLSTYNNNAFIQTGHTNGQATPDEQKIIANIIFYMVAKQYGAE